MIMERLKIGDKFNYLTVIGPPSVRESKKGKRENYYLCQCACGATTLARSPDLKGGNTKSCGCLSAKVGRERQTTHGKSKSRVYRVWENLKKRCNNPLCPSYRFYGAKGITVCSKWETFQGFYEDVGEPPYATATLDRIDPKGNYELSNIRWASQVEQQRNRTNNRRFYYEGENLTAAEWAERIGVSSKTMASRLLLRGWSIERAIHQPIREGGNRKGGGFYDKTR